MPIYCPEKSGALNSQPALRGDVWKARLVPQGGRTHQAEGRVYENPPLGEGVSDFDRQVYLWQRAGRDAWLMFCSDGATPLLDIAERSKIPMRQLFETAVNLEEHGLLEIQKA